MYKVLTFIVLVIISGASARTRAINEKSNPIQLVPSSSFNQGSNGLDWCPECVSGFGQLISGVLDVVLEYGVLNTCGDLCDLVAKKTDSGFLGFLCDVGCDVLGLEAFVKLVEIADLDPIYYCEEMKLCPVNDNGDANFTTFVILPARGTVGTTFDIDYSYLSKNGTGTGEMTINIKTVDKLPLSATFLAEAKKAGTYTQRITVDATPDPDCDPTADQCEEWLPGFYNVSLVFCNGECGSRHPHTQLYAVANATFEIYE